MVLGLLHACFFASSLLHTPAMCAVKQSLNSSVLAAISFMQDTSLLAEAQSQFTAAATAAQQHHQHMQQLIQQQLAAAPSSTKGATSSSRQTASHSGSGVSSGCWLAVNTAAHHVLATYRSATLRLQQLTCLVEAREKILHDIQQVQLQQQAAQQQGRAAGKGLTVLTAFELHLLSHPALLQQHQEALAQAVNLLQQQEECRQHANVFFAWVTSAAAEVQQQLLQGDTAAASISSGSSTTSKATASQHQQQQQRQTGSVLALPAPPMRELVPLAQQLPLADTPIAAGVLARVQKQLQAAAAAAGIAWVPAGTPATAAAAAEQIAQQLGAVDIAGGLDGQLPQQQQQVQARAATGSCTQAAAAALVQAGTAPAVHTQALRALPEDLQHSMQQLQDAQDKQQHHRREQLAAQQEVQQCCSLRRTWMDPLVKAPKQQQEQQQAQQQMTGVRPIPGLAAVRALGGVMPSGVPAQPQQLCSDGVNGGSSRQQQADDSSRSVDVSEELQRLNQLALHVAKALAKTRAGNKQQLAAAAQMLLEAGEESDGGQMVLYQS